MGQSASRSRRVLARHAGRRERGDAGRLRILLEKEIRSEHWREGDRLPTERELCARHGVARNTLRRALQSLEEQKLIVRHVGRGTFKTGIAAQDPGDDFELDRSERFSPADVMECRLIFEPGLVSQVVARATKTDLDRMAECLKRGEASKSLAEFEHWDAELHDAIAVATHNSIAISMYRSLANVRQQARWGMLKARTITPDRMQKLQAEHSAIIAALRERDHSEAHALLRKHLLHVREYMFGE